MTKSIPLISMHGNKEPINLLRQQSIFMENWTRSVRMQNFFAVCQYSSRNCRSFN